MFMRKALQVVVVGCGLGGIAFGCASTQRPTPLARAKMQPPVVAEPAPVPAPAWTPADPPRDQQVMQAAAQTEAEPAPRLIATSEDQGKAPVAVEGPAIVPAKPPAAPVPAAPVQVAAADAPAKVRDLYRQAAQAYAGIDSYIARLRRREVVGGSLKPEEVMLFKFRKTPWSVYFKWLGEEGKGREAIYVKGQYDNKLHTLLAAGDVPFAPAGKRMALDPDSILVRSRSRHTVHEAGIGHIIAELGKGLQAEDAGGKAPPLRYLGPVERPEYAAPLEGIEYKIPPGDEIPGGGSRQIFFDPASHLPVLLVTKDAQGKELEYYCYDRLQYPVHLDDDDFNPDKLWPVKK